MTTEEYQEEIRRRDEIIDANFGVLLDNKLLRLKENLITTIAFSDCTDLEKIKIIKNIMS